MASCLAERERLNLTIAEAQQDNRRAFVGGGPGAFISGILWVTSSVVLKLRGVEFAFTVLFFGGMLIFPLSLLVSRQLFKRPSGAKSNELSRVALESTIAMIGGLFGAWLFLFAKPAYVFPLAAIAVGTHYAAFRTVYGNTLFWTLAGLITAVGLFDILGYVRFPGGPTLAVGLLEIVFGILLTMRDKESQSVDHPII